MVIQLSKAKNERLKQELWHQSNTNLWVSDNGVSLAIIVCVRLWVCIQNSNHPML